MRRRAGSGGRNSNGSNEGDWEGNTNPSGDSGARVGKKGLFGGKSKQRLEDEDGASSVGLNPSPLHLRARARLSPRPRRACVLADDNVRPDWGAPPLAPPSHGGMQYGNNYSNEGRSSGSSMDSMGHDRFSTSPPNAPAPKKGIMSRLSRGGSQKNFATGPQVPHVVSMGPGAADGWSTHPPFGNPHGGQGLQAPPLGPASTVYGDQQFAGRGAAGQSLPALPAGGAHPQQVAEAADEAAARARHDAERQEQEELEIAMAMSMSMAEEEKRTQQRAPREAPLVEVQPSAEDEDLQRALELSRQEAERGGAAPQRTAANDLDSLFSMDAPVPPPSAGGNGFGSNDAALASLIGQPAVNPQQRAGWQPQQTAPMGAPNPFAPQGGIAFGQPMAPMGSQMPMGAQQMGMQPGFCAQHNPAATMGFTQPMGGGMPAGMMAGGQMGQRPANYYGTGAPMGGPPIPAAAPAPPVQQQPRDPFASLI